MDYNLDILVVDDSRLLAQGMEECLKKLGLKTSSLTDSTKVIDFVKKNKPRFILTDIMMPIVDGFALCNMIKAENNLKDIRVAMISSKIFDTDRERAYRAGAEAFIEKADSLDLQAKRVKELFNEPVQVRFWGTRGSVPVPGRATIKYGGNTPCVEVRPGGDSIIIFDAGTGIRVLGDDLTKKKAKIRAHIFFSHFHWDHIQGLPFFGPAYLQDNHIYFYGYEDNEARLGKIISDQMESTYYPVPITRFGAKIHFKPIVGEKDYQIENFVISTICLNHPGNTLGYMLRHRTKLIAYLSDNEVAHHKKEEVNEYNNKIVNFAKGADLLIVDAQYNANQYKTKRGWGHSNYLDILEIGLSAKVKRIALFHHDPARTDDDMDEIVSECRAIIKDRGSETDCFGAQEGMVVTL